MYYLWWSQINKFAIQKMWKMLPISKGGEFMKVFIDLFAGLGGASEAFHQSSEWTTIRIDNNPDLLEHTHGLILSDITDVHATLNIIYATLDIASITKLVIWASPPCDEFSYAYHSKRSIAMRAGEHYQPNMSLLIAAQQIIDELKPDFYYIENVRGAINDFTEILGTPWTQQVGSFFLWGFHPMIAFKDNNLRYLTKTDKRHSPMRAQIRAKVPLEISQAVMDSIDKQRTLEQYCDLGKLKDN